MAAATFRGVDTQNDTFIGAKKMIYQIYTPFHVLNIFRYIKAQVHEVTNTIHIMQ